jgi:hypothetical protein
MTLDETLLQKLAEWRPDSDRPTLTLADADSGWRIELTSEKNDDIGCRVSELSLSGPAPVTNLRAWAVRTVDRATGLLEPLVLHELDTAGGVALLRSRSPAQRGDTLSYYELALKAAGSANLRRYQARPGARREQVPFALTHEALAKVVGDLTAPA